jgi:phage terminase large subunit-like protein
MGELKRYYQYVENVRHSKVLACDALKKAVARFKTDLAASRKRGARWVFDEAQADSIIRFTEKLVQFEDPFAGQPIHLEPWECFFLGQLYGWRDKKTGLRRFKKAMLFMGRKQGKTILASVIALFEIITRHGVEAYSLATVQLIANKSFENISRFIQRNPRLSELLDIHKSPKSVINEARGSRFIPLSSDGDLDGLNPLVAIIDELAAQKNGEAYNKLTSGMGARPERLTVIISTAAASLTNPLIDEYSYAKKILDGSLSDDSYLVSIYEYDKTDKWDDLDKLQKSCPNLGVTVPVEYFKDEVKRAHAIPLIALEYKVKYCNLWQAAVDTWIPDRTWQVCAKLAKTAQITSEELRTAPCVAALDFSTIWDWTANTKYYYIERLGKYFARHRYYIPEAQVETKMHLENPSIRAWIEAGRLVATPGETIDYSFVYKDLDADLADSDILAVTYDPAKAKEFEMEYSTKATIIPFLQRSANLSPAAKAWEKAIVDKLIIDDCPILRWMVSNTINKSNPDSGSYFITKSQNNKARKRIDGVITSMMAYAVLREQIAAKAARPKIFDLSKIQY